MARIITDELFAKLVKVLGEDEKIRVFQQLLTSQQLPVVENTEEEKPASEGN